MHDAPSILRSSERLEIFQQIRQSGLAPAGAVVRPRIVVSAIAVPVTLRIESEISLRIRLIGHQQTHIDEVRKISATIEDGPARLQIDELSQGRHTSIVQVRRAGEQ